MMSAPQPPMGPPQVPGASDWEEHISQDGPQKGKKYYYNKRTAASSWEKPAELMTIEERADAMVRSEDASSYISSILGFKFLSGNS